MSAAWTKQLLLDYGLNRLSIDQKSDIASAIHGLIQSRVLSPMDVYILDLYVSGYTAVEIAETYLFDYYGSIIPLQTNDVENTLARVILAISTASGYTDDIIIERAKQHQIRTRVPKFITYLEQHSTNFMEHDI